jgi:hypothetical protein
VIYFIEDVEGDQLRIKIGTSIDPIERLSALMTEIGRPLKLLGVMPGRHNEEFALHQRFAHLRSEKEWFRATKELGDFISTNAEPWDDSRHEREERRTAIGGQDNLAGPVLAANLVRLGYGKPVVRVREVAEIVTTRTGRRLGSQRLAQLINCVTIHPEMIEFIARGLDVDPDELTKPPDISENGKG